LRLQVDVALPLVAIQGQGERRGDRSPLSREGSQSEAR
jgi:hypothetical protein